MSLLLGDQTEQRSLSWVTSEWHRLNSWGLMYAVSFVLDRFVEDREKFSEIAEDVLDIENNDSLVVELLNKSGNDIWIAVQTVLDAIVEANDMQ